MLTVNPKGIPETIKNQRAWVCWKAVKRSGKIVKIPIQPNGQPARVDDPETWNDYLDALAPTMTGGADGIGFIIPPGMVGIDLDDCVNENGVLSERAKLVLALIDSYAEFSPSGTGIKFLAFGNSANDLKKIDHSAGIEIYDGESTNRFFCLTGRQVENRSEIKSATKSIAKIQSMITKPAPTKSGTDDYQTASEYLENIDAKHANEYSDWLAVGMALHHCDPSPEMLNRWDRWSKQSAKYVEGDCARKWESFKRESGALLTINYLRSTAKSYGYDPGIYQTRAISARDLLAKEIETSFLVDDLLVEGEPMIIGGPAKCLKTSILVDLAVSLATGKPFLGHFEIVKPSPVMLISGESGERSLQQTFAAVAARKAIGKDDLLNAFVSTRLPRLTSEDDMRALRDELLEASIPVCAVDPLYMAMPAGDGASNVYAMGEKFAILQRIFTGSGITLILAHHMRKGVGYRYTEAPQIADLSQSGTAEFARQVVLVKRRKSYERDGNHCLWFDWGGSAGHQGQGILDVETGTAKTGITWNPRLYSVDEWDTQHKKDGESREDRQIEKRILGALGVLGSVSGSCVCQSVPFRRSEVYSTLNRLHDAGLVDRSEGVRGAQIWKISTNGCYLPNPDFGSEL